MFSDVFLSRFVGETTNPARARHVNQVLANVREGCHREGRVWALMLDLSMGRGDTTAAVMDDWKFLCDKVKVREDSRYLHHRKKPVVLLWGLGFKDRPWTPERPVVAEEEAARVASIDRMTLRKRNFIPRSAIPYKTDVQTTYDSGEFPAIFDKAMTLGYNHPMGPLRLTDVVGLDVRLAIAQYLEQALGSPVFRAPEVLKRLVSEGKLGKKTGQGFYTWTEQP